MISAYLHDDMSEPPTLCCICNQRAGSMAQRCAFRSIRMLVGAG